MSNIQKESETRTITFRGPDGCEHTAIVIAKFASLELLEQRLSYGAAIELNAAGNETTKLVVGPPLPREAPILWKHRTAHGYVHRESPAAFIEKVYGPVRGQFTLAELRDLDPNLVTRYSDWSSDGGIDPPNFKLPKEKSTKHARRNRLMTRNATCE